MPRSASATSAPDRSWNSSRSFARRVWWKCAGLTAVISSRRWRARALAKLLRSRRRRPPPWRPNRWRRKLRPVRLRLLPALRRLPRQRRLVPAPAPASPEDSLAALRQALPSHFEKAPNRPLYLRQIRQLLRAAGSSVDERSGFRGLLDLLHQAQREGWLRLHRDRKGVWRVFPAACPAPALTPATPAEVAVEVEAPPELEPDIPHACRNRRELGGGEHYRRKSPNLRSRRPRPR